MASLDAVDVQLGREISFGRGMLLFPDVVQSIEAQKLFETFFAAFLERLLALELRLVLLDESVLFPLVAFP